MMTALLAVTMAAAPVQQLDTTLTVRSGVRVSIENMNGSVSVNSWDRNQLRVRASSRREVEIDADESSVRIETDVRRGLPAGITYEITLPRRADVEVEGINLTVDVREVTGDVNVETVNGTITLSGLDGRINAETVQGSLTVRSSRGDLDVGNANGSITIEDHEGDVVAEGVNGSIILRSIRSAAVDAETVNGPIEYAGQVRDGGRYTFSTHSGNVTLFVPEGANAAVSVETFSGQIEADFPIQVRRVGRGEDMTFTLGSGSARIEIESFGGLVRLRRPGAGNR